jgi:hypothetical protein
VHKQSASDVVIEFTLIFKTCEEHQQTLRFGLINPHRAIFVDLNLFIEVRQTQLKLIDHAEIINTEQHDVEFRSRDNSLLIDVKHCGSDSIFAI